MLYHLSYSREQSAAFAQRRRAPGSRPGTEPRTRIPSVGNGSYLGGITWK